MTKMIIDNRATAAKRYEAYEVDRNEYPTNESLAELAYDCMNEDVYSITIYVNEEVLMKPTNGK